MERHAVDFQRDQFELLGEFRPHISCADFFSAAASYSSYKQINKRTPIPIRTDAIRPAAAFARLCFLELFERDYSLRDLT
ncbi:hypothetical protein [Bradyrhizobium sp. BRP56]|uniref:hypothetical protein n=1 Tax=Bradyrhizobium sp. BRP56 TaxID=2793819 RepID=UPI001CD1997E|nr:hypothetical protein [Bradyrhizobium sp. BRP56]MCA1395674.1 hypothetical protein [Bradyrhizobium sp. BRP56]